MLPTRLFLLLAAAACLPAWPDAGVPLRIDRRLSPPPPKVERDVVRFLSADRLIGNTGSTVTATGNVEMRQRGLSIRADQVDYDGPTETAVATGNVVIDRAGDVVEGPRLVYQLAQETGEMDRPTFTIPKRDDRRSASRGSALRAVLEPDERSRLYDATYTTCPVPRDDWTLRVGELELDGKSQVGTARNAAVYFFGVPILYSPWLTFPTDSARKTGFLPPTLGSSGKGGFELAVPWYWNISPDQDATLTPKIFTKRGLQLGGEYRYLRPGFSGELNTEILPNDALADRDRYLFSYRHRHQLPLGWWLSVNAQRVSDDNYFRDLSTRVAATSQTNLPRDVMLGYADDVWALGARAISYQTLQDPLAPIVTPYRQLPQLSLSAVKPNVQGADLRLASEFTQFRHPDLTEGHRFISYPQIQYPLRRSWGYISPKAGLHLTRYGYLGEASGTGAVARTVPIASLDAALFFDRPLTLAGSDWLQTLEPRLFYLRVPYRNQSALPNFSTAEIEFGTNSLFRENRFIGGDRIGDANQLTAAITSRLLEANSGLERLAATLGQVYYFDPPRVQLDSSSPTALGSRSDVVALLSGQVSRSFSIDGAAQLNTGNGLAQRLDVSARFNPEPGSVLNASWRFTRDRIRQVDLSGQWPIARGLRAVGRWNWSLDDRKLVEGLAGFEYNAGCWEIRAVAHRFITATQQVSTSFQVQLELSGLSRIGINPLETLRQNIGGYRRSDEITK